jgi:hypothetical protein
MSLQISDFRRGIAAIRSLAEDKPGGILDYDAAGSMVEMEILDASHVWIIQRAWSTQ